MKKNYLLLAALACLSVSCSAARVYKAPSVEATRAGITASQGRVASAQGKVASAQTHVGKAKTRADSTKVLVEKIRDDKTATDTIRELARQALSDVDSLTQELLETQAALVDTQTDLVETQKALAGSQANASKLQGDIQAQTDTLNATTADLAKTKSAYHKLKFGVIALAMALTVAAIYMIVGFGAFAPPILYGTIAAPLAVGAFLLFKL